VGALILYDAQDRLSKVGPSQRTFGSVGPGVVTGIDSFGRGVVENTFGFGERAMLAENAKDDSSAGIAMAAGGLLLIGYGMLRRR
jgi:hypothetical protein